MFQQESIYNIVPTKKLIPDRPPYYISNYPHDIPPTASTFILPGSSVPGISNCSGEFKLPRGGHPTLKKSATFGQPIGYYQPDPRNFHKKGNNYKILPPLEKLHINCKIKKPPIPSVNDKPIMGIKSRKNYILSNAIDNILMKPRKIRPNKSCEDLKHPFYGEVPTYIKRFKAQKQTEINNEKN